MNLLQKFFSFKGRLRRRDYWLCNLALGVAIGVIVFPLIIALKIQPEDPRFQAATLVFLWPSIAILVKRIHDRDKTGWMAANYWVPSLVSMGLSFLSDPEFAMWKVFVDIGTGMVGLWYLVEFGFMDGTQGKNAYGPSPKGVEPTEKVAEVFS
ncbi:DUF805 domain-containing protein [Caulobacter sp. UNC358MFTsu5.1]|uniref:DUF805 domain-containing protein n=1 Tax=Caulobacter sp. UNC358MFTsu5.1 TaxID=1449049 RepID=UPI0004A76A21|nr:DUF805 domain-containing protein [Caulobacter sp. UNC358MFTsu5.1]